MAEERREGYVALGKKLDDHIVRFDEYVAERKTREAELLSGEFMLPNGRTLKEQVEEHEDLQEGQHLIIAAIAGKEVHDPLTDEVSFEGGLRQEIGDIRSDLKQLRYQASNGGVNAKVKFTTAQKVALGLVGVPAIASVVITFLQITYNL